MEGSLIDRVILTNIKSNHGMIEDENGYYYKTDAEAEAHVIGIKVGAKKIMEVYGALALAFLLDAINGDYNGLDEEEILKKFYPRWIVECGHAYNDYAEGENEVARLINAMEEHGTAKE